MNKTIERMTGEVRAWCVRKGWRGEDAPPRTFGDEVALIHSELSEALEAFRIRGTNRWSSGVAADQMPFNMVKGQVETLPTDELGYVIGAKPEGVPSELADVFIRLLDTCAEYGIDLEAEYEAKMKYNENRDFRHGGKRL